MKIFTDNQLAERDRQTRKELYEQACKDIARSNEKLFDMIDSDLSFSAALIKLQEEKKLTRKGWNGKGLFVVYQKAYPKGIPCNNQTAMAWGMKPGETFRCEPYFQINTVSGSHAMWVPSVSDLLAHDWMIYSPDACDGTAANSTSAKASSLVTNTIMTEATPATLINKGSENNGQKG